MIGVFKFDQDVQMTGWFKVQLPAFIPLTSAFDAMRSVKISVLERETEKMKITSLQCL